MELSQKDTEKIRLIKSGVELCSNNPFFENLRLILRFLMSREPLETNVAEKLLKSINQTELELKTYAIYKELAIRVYAESLRYLFYFDDSIEDVTFALIAKVKEVYDTDRAIVKPYVEAMEQNMQQVLTEYKRATEPSIEGALLLLSRAEELESEAVNIRAKAITILERLRS